MMQIISHRGYWVNADEKNTSVAFDRSFSSGFGTETDLRDYHDGIVISHDIATKYSIPAKTLFETFIRYNPSLPLAINIKADGLQIKLKALLQHFNITNYFVFDMSVPDTIGYLDHEMRVFSRQSEYEPEPVFYEKCAGIWLDAFIDRWYNAELITKHINNNKQVAIVSFDLHKRDQYPLWIYLKKNDLHKLDEVILCTDLPEEASRFFNE